MSFGNNLKKIFTDTARIAVKKSGEVIESAKAKYTEFDIQSSIDNLYMDLGKIVYNGYKTDEDVSDSITNLCDEIQSKISELSNIKNKTDNFSYYIVCPSCSKGCDPKASFCPYCGEKLG